MRRMLFPLAVMMALAGVTFGQPPEVLLGTWEWTRTDYVAGGTATPESTGHTHQIMFGEWQKYEHYTDDQLDHRGTWEVTDMLIFPYTISVLSTDDGNTYLTWYVGDGELVVKDWVQLPFGIYGPHTRTDRYQPRGVVSAESVSFGMLKASYH